MIAILNLDSGGPDRNRTDVRGFAVPCIATLPPGQAGLFARRRGLIYERCRQAVKATGTADCKLPGMKV